MRSKNALLFFLVAFCRATFAVDPGQQLQAMTDRMAAQAQRDMALAGETTVMVPSGPHLGEAVADPNRLPFYRSLRHVQFSDSFVAHTVHEAIDEAGTRRIVVLVHGIVRGDTSGWHVAANQVVSPAAGTSFVGSDAQRVACTTNGNPMLVFGYLKRGKGYFEGSGEQIFALDSYSNPIPLTGYRVACATTKS